MGVIRNILSSRSNKGGNFFSVLNKTLGFKPKNVLHYRRAFTHRSLNIKDEKGNAISFERDGIFG